MFEQPLVGQVLPIVNVSRLHSDTPHLVEILWTNGHPEAKTSTWQHTIQQTDIHAHGEIRTLNPSKRAAAEQHRRPRGQYPVFKAQLDKFSM